MAAYGGVRFLHAARAVDLDTNSTYERRVVGGEIKAGVRDVERR
jgi:hypothetical protein